MVSVFVDLSHIPGSSTVAKAINTIVKYDLRWLEICSHYWLQNRLMAQLKNIFFRFLQFTQPKMAMKYFQANLRKTMDKGY